LRSTAKREEEEAEAETVARSSIGNSTQAPQAKRSTNVLSEEEWNQNTKTRKTEHASNKE